MVITSIQKVIVVFLLLSCSIVNAQKLTPFSNNIGTFPEEVDVFLDSHGQDISKNVLNNFYLYWINSIDENQAKKIIKISNDIFSKRITASTFLGFKNFIETINLFLINEYYYDFNTWISSCSSFLPLGNFKQINAFFKTYFIFLNKQELYSSDGFTWKINNSDFSFKITDSLGITFNDIDLICYSPLNDTITLLETSGLFDVVNQKVYILDGKVNWDRVNLASDSVYAKISPFTLDITKSILEIDTVYFLDLYFFKNPIAGSFEDRIVNVSSKNIRYPRFKSFDKKLVLEPVFGEIQAKGGFLVEGNNFYLYGDDNDRAHLFFLKNDTLLFKTFSQKYFLSNDRITSDQVTMTLLLKSDSIHHPALTFRYNFIEKKITFYRENEGLRQVPFINSYHNLDMFFQLLTWDYNQEKIVLSNLLSSEYRPITFRSENYFRDRDFEMLTGLGGDNPLIALYRLSMNYGAKKEFYIQNIAYDLRLSEHSAQLILIDLAIKGYINYDEYNQKITLKEQLFNTVNAQSGRIDYDVIKFISSGSTENAFISLLNYELTISGVSNISLSDSKNVRIFPYDETIVMSENRNFHFDGLVKAGRFDFFGHNYKFDYENFRIDMPSADSMKFRVPTDELYDYTNYKLINVKTILYDLTGELFIDHPYNKSGKNFYSQYPIFKSEKGAYVFYDKPNLFNGVYDRDLVYFKIEPFELDSLDNFRTETLTFNGVFETNGMFPTFSENLKVQEDYSLGFLHKTAINGFPVYEGKGVFENQISVSNKGIIGDGTIKYLTSTAYSNEIYFFPDSVNMNSSTFNIEPQILPIEYPIVASEKSSIHWLPLKEKMSVTSRKKHPASIFEDNVFNIGTLELTPESLKGNGKLNFDNAFSNSDQYIYKNNSFSSEDMEFRIKRTESEPWMLILSSTRGKVDFEERLAILSLNDGVEYLELPINQYLCSAEQITWIMDEQKILLRQLSNLKSELVSVHPEQDSLNFYANEVDINLKNYIINADGVEEVVVADAAILPDSSKVEIGPEAKIHQLKNAIIITDIIDEYHTIDNADIQIKGKNSFDGSGDYSYKFDNEIQKIYLDKLGVTIDNKTYAKGYINKNQDFYLSPFFAYYGNVSLYSHLPYLAFDGRCKIQHTCKNIITDWFAINDTIDSDLIMLNLAVNDSVLTRNKGLLGIYTTNDSLHYYSSFLAPKRNNFDKNLIAATGYLFYDDIHNEYVVESTYINEVDDYWMTFNNKNCIVTFSGYLNLYDNKNHLKTESYGLVTHNLLKNELLINATIGVDFFFDSDALNVMEKSIMKEDMLLGADVEDPLLAMYIKNRLGDKESKNVINNLITFGEVKNFPKELKTTFLLSEVELYYDKLTKSFISSDDFSVISIFDNYIGRRMPGIIEILSKRTGYEIYFLFDVNPSEWYFYQYRSNLMQVISSLEEFNNFLRELPSKKRTLKSKDEGIYQFILSGKRRLDTYLYRFEN